MQLKSFRVRKFRNIVDSGDVTVSDSVTCLVGKNEAGKSGLLEALYLLRPAYKDKPDVEKQYPRWLLAKDRRSSDINAVEFITATFVLEKEDAEAVGEAVGEAVAAGESFELSLSYSGKTWWRLKTKEAAIVKHFRDQISTDVLRVAGKTSTLEELADAIGDWWHEASGID